MKKQHVARTAFPLLCTALVAGCNGQWQPQLQSPIIARKDIGYVSASPHAAEASYVSALQAAMEEDQATATPNKPAAKNQHTSLTQESGGLFGIPAGGTGLTLLNPETRARLNDALSTTPTGQSVQWHSGELTYSLAPNSPVYIPQHSGGNCRDAVLSIYGDGFTNIRKRNLFCQAGPSSDWMIILEEAY